MLAKSRRTLIDVSQHAVDAAAFATAAGLSVLTASRFEPGAVTGAAANPAVVFVLLAGLLAGHNLRRVPATRLSHTTGRFRRSVLSTLLSTSAIAVGGIAVQTSLLTSQTFLVAFSALYFSLLVGSGFAVQAALHLARRRGRNLRHAVILGSGPRAIAIAEHIQRRPDLGYNLVGFVDDRMPTAAFGLKYLGRISDLEKLADDGDVDEVFIGLPIRSMYDQINQCLELCEVRGIAAHLPTDIFTFSIASSTIERLGDTTLLSHRSAGPMDGIPYLLKRGMDVVGGTALLVVLSPVFALISLAILISMGRPIFFRQSRAGYLRRTFSCFKFRTMVPNAAAMLPSLEALNELDGPAFKLRDDPRVTRLGRFLRATSIDELPQLVNVVRGEMSLVGPRPLPLRDVAHFDRGEFHRRFVVRPGITCTWQISGRSQLTFEEWIRSDLEYIDNWNLRRDLWILIATIPAVLKRNGAY